MLAGEVFHWSLVGQVECCYENVLIKKCISSVKKNILCLGWGFSSKLKRNVLFILTYPAYPWVSGSGCLPGMWREEAQVPFLDSDPGLESVLLWIPKLQVEMMLTGKAPSFPPSLVTPLRPVTACLAANQCTFLSSLNILTTSKGYMCR